ncbi:MAG: ParB/RepB/Spo0J family partition protein [Acidobacteria bacterium]|jgi:ParB family chromosome partitioning protein|nr:ParB/RepB/Spo0J family partition protein [Acidobacteriota bacterium]
MSKKALGRGLNALLGEERKNKYNEEFLEIDVDLIDPNSEQPRINFNEENLQELAQSIKANGVVQPIVVRRRGGRYQIIAGERRWRASQKAGLPKVPAIIKEVNDNKLLELALIENIQRQDLNAIEEAKAYKNLIISIGLTQEMIAERVGKNRTVITTCLRLLKLPEDIQKLVEEEKISPGHGRALLMTDDVELQRRIAHKVLEMTLSVRETEKAVKRVGKDLLKEFNNKLIKPKIDANIKTAEAKLRRKLSTQIHIIPDGKGTGGKIEIEYYSESDLNRIYDLIIDGK